MDHLAIVLLSMCSVWMDAIPPLTQPTQIKMKNMCPSFIVFQVFKVGRVATASNSISQLATFQLMAFTSHITGVPKHLLLDQVLVTFFWLAHAGLFYPGKMVEYKHMLLCEGQGSYTSESQREKGLFQVLVREFLFSVSSQCTFVLFLVSGLQKLEILAHVFLSTK